MIIAAYNEETVITRTVESILNNGYPDLEIIVVDDGSKDGTLRGAARGFRQPSVGSDSDAAERGKIGRAQQRDLACAQHEILVAVDADTLFRTGTIAKLVRHFSDPRVGAVSGNARVGNRQQMDYAISIHRIHLRLQSGSARARLSERHYGGAGRGGGVAQGPGGRARAGSAMTRWPRMPILRWPFAATAM